ncbi:MAG: lysine--tRNA ligase, partial [Candidatus Roizmanbacteria bacterium]|nr:lysine--tRNA ligase [Candidatus Roizmanbacteria bacterium]
MFWVDEIAQKIGNIPQHVDDMKTLSGYPHIGSLRGPILHDVVYKALHEKNNKTVNTYVFNDFDPIDGLSPDLLKTHTRYFGYPLRLAPSPDKKARSFADFFAEDFKNVLETLGIEADYLSSWDMYHEGTFNDAIKVALDNAEKIQDIYQKVSGSKKKEQGWYPLQVICPKCSRVGTTKVTAWDGKLVTYTCEKNLVVWAEGCGHTGTMSPFDGNAKLPWKVDWPAHWMVLGVTFEGAGKDHASRGGSYDIAFALCDEVFKSKRPYYFPYEFFLFGGRKMSTSKGTGVKARDIISILPAEIARFILVRSKPKTAIDFDPTGMTIPDMFDEFDRCAQEYWLDPSTDLGRVFHFSQVNTWYGKKIYLPRFRDVANILQLHTVDPKEHFEKEKGSALTAIERDILEQRISYAQNWLKNFAPESARFSISEKLPKEVAALSSPQKEYLLLIRDLVENYENPEALQVSLYDASKFSNLSGKEAFQAIYISLLGKPFGPKAGWFIDSLDKEFVIKRLEEASGYEPEEHL